MLARSAREGSAVTVLFIDLDDFKLVNDTLSHRAGDQLLVAVAGRLREAVRDADTVGRLGGDEFVVLTESSAAGEDPGEIAGRLSQALGAPFGLKGHPGPLQAKASIGVAVAAAGSSAEQLLCDADVAMYGAKSKGGGCARFEPGMQEALAGYGRSQVSRRPGT